MKLGRLFWTLTRYARAARFWLLLALATFAFFGCNEARAQEGFQCLAQYNNCQEPTQAQAWASIMHVIQQRNIEAENPNPQPYVCGASLNAFCVAIRGGFGWEGVTRSWATGCPEGTIWNGKPGQTRCMPSCSGRGSPTFRPGSGAMIPNGSVGCSDGCEYMTSSNGDGTYTRFFIGDSATNHCSVVPNDCSANGAGYTMNYGMSMCVPPTAECSPNEIKDPLTGMCTQGCPAGMVTDATGMCVPEADNCPAGNIRSPSGECLPGEGQCAAGEARKPDGTCGRDSDGDGQADEFDPETDSTSFSGGDNCNAPPSCSGDPIQCGMARIQWRIECNTRKDATVSGGSCSAMPVCVGKNCNALEYSQLLQQWRTTCALEKLAQGTPGGGNGDEDGPQSCGPGKSDAECAAGQNIGDEGDPSSAMVENEYLESGFDSSGYGWSSSCPSIPPISFQGYTIDLQSRIGPLCDWIQLGGIFLMITTGILCLVILMRV